MSYHDVECPYCGKDQEICHDDGYGYEEDETHEQECNECDKTFIYTTGISFYYEASQAEWKNDGEHKWKDVTCIPVEAGIGRQFCEICDEKRDIDPEGRRVAMENYFIDLRERHA